MNVRKDFKIAVIMAVILFLVGIICYAAFPVKTPEKPVRLMFKCKAGKVLFTHSTHASDSGYGLSCTDCHHHNEDDEASFMACSECHVSEESTAVPQSCENCHELDENHHEADSEKACADCHMLGEGGQTPETCNECHEPEDIEGQGKSMNLHIKSDAFHAQCINCHKDNDAGPVKCSECHVMQL